MTKKTKLKLFNKKILTKPKVKLLQEESQIKALTSGYKEKPKLVSEGETGYFKEEYEKESKWLGRYSL